MNRIALWGALASAALFAGRASAVNVEFQPWLSGFRLPVNITNAGDGTNRLFVCEQYGRLRIIKDGVLLENDFINLSATGLNRCSPDGAEQGLLAIAFDPDYKNSGVCYLSYTERVTGRSILARYHVDPENPDQLLPTEESILEQQTPQRVHHAGNIAFGPDGYLYMSIGDGGGIGDDEPGHTPVIGNAQDTTNLMGDLMRIDVSTTSPPLAYAIPPDNPFVGSVNGDRPEIFAYGFRNPWRYSFDRFNGRLFLGDVGDFFREEVDLVVKGGNYGWKRMEGLACYSPTTGCQTGSLILPFFEYNHNTGGCCIIGGNVYRGAAYPAMDGLYICSDYCSLKGYVLGDNGDGTWTKIAEPVAPESVSAFGQDEAGELYLTAHMGGEVYKVVDTDPQPTFRSKGDLNGDYCTDLGDFLIVLDNWDAMLDGTLVGLSDFLALLDNWHMGTRCA